jgi:hypothetical protein
MMNAFGRLVCGASVGVGLLFAASPNQLRAEPESGVGAIRPAGDWPTVIGAWFWTDQTMGPDGYKSFLDAAAAHSPYTLLSTAARISKGEIVEPQVFEQMRKAVGYARALGLGIALEVDVRVARAAFRARYPDEQQEELVLKTVELSASSPTVVTFEGKDLADHMVGSAPPFLCLTTRLVRAYCFARRSDGIDPATVREIGASGIRAVAEGPGKLMVTIPPETGMAGCGVCVIASHGYFTPDVFAPHLLSFQREIIRQYAGLPLAGVMKDEWGFPPDHTGNPAHDRYWYSAALAQAYSKRTAGRDLVRDSLLMFAGERGRERERQAAINHYRELCRERNAAVEKDFYQAGKEVFGSNSLIVTHATWFPYPGVQEFRKNGLDWWAATRDIGQCDESTPYPCRTSLAKRWGYPLWYNQFYASTLEPYARELWADALSGGRLNVHQLYPHSGTLEEKCIDLMRQPFMAGMARLRMLDFIARAPLDCPVAVIFGHASAMNWAASGYDDVGLGIAAELCGGGYPADLFPTSLIGTPALRVDADGFVCLGVQRYRAVVLYHPEFEGKATLEFFEQAIRGRTAVFVVGDWTRDFDATSFDALTLLRGAKLHHRADNATCAAAARELLEAAGIERCTAWSVRQTGTSFDALPPMDGHSRLTDGTYVRIAGTKNAEGDPINETFACQGHSVAVDATGLVAIRFSANGKVAALAVGGMKSIRTDGLEIALPERIDFAFRTEADGRVCGVIQGWTGPVPDALRAITTDWQRLSIPPLLPATVSK